MSVETKQPVFIVASVRSGSTMLRLMLDHHPEIVNPGECDFLFDHVQDNGAMPDAEEYAYALRLNRIYLDKGLTIDTTLSYSDIMQSFIRQLGSAQETLTMNIHLNFHRIPFVFPKASYIHLLRDPRDVARSCVAMGWTGHVYYGVDTWKTAEESWDRLKKQLESNQYLEIKYEDLLEDVEAGLTQICGFLGLKYSEAMLSYQESTSYTAPDKKLCYQWKTKLSIRELQLVEGKIGQEIVTYGYTLSKNEPRIPNLLERLTLKTASRIKRANRQIKKYGAKLYLLTLIANRLGVSSLQNSCQKQKNRVDRLNLK